MGQGSLFVKRGPWPRKRQGLILLYVSTNSGQRSAFAKQKKVRELFIELPDRGSVTD